MKKLQIHIKNKEPNCSKHFLFKNIVIEQNLDQENSFIQSEMSIEKIDIVNALCLAHRIVQYEKSPPKKYILMKFKNKTLEIAAHLLLQVSHELIDCVDTQQQTATEASQSIAPMSGWDTTPTSVIRL